MAKQREGRSRGMGHAELRLAVLQALTDAGDRGITKAEMVAKIGNTTGVSVQRALKELRACDAQIECRRPQRRWRLTSPFTMPLDAPEAEDVVAVLVAKEILTPLADADLVERIERLAEHLDERRRIRGGARVGVSAPVSATLTLGTTIEPGVLRTLLGACRRQRLRMLYESPWKPAGDGRRWYEIEPWALRIHDGAAYLRAWSRDRADARTFRVGQIEAIDPMPLSGRRLARVPVGPAVWGDGDPAFGIDHDRSGVAVVVIHGAVARWVHRVQWHPSQRDRWIEAGEVLERTVPYRSCRELARRIASVYDGVGGIEPAELRDEVSAIVRGRVVIELPGVMQRVPATARVSPPAVEDGSTRAADE